MARLSLTIYLIKTSYSRREECIRESDRATLDSHVVDISGSTTGTLYLRRNRAKPPDWKPLFPDVDWSRYRTNTFSGLLLIDVKGRRFAITSGSGRYLLNPFAIEDSFGFKTVLNSVDPSTIRKIEKKTINQNPVSSIEQLTRTSSLDDFQVDYYTDIISKIRAKSSISKLGTIIDGRDSLQIAIDCDLKEIPEILRTCLASYGSNAYLKHFPNIDNIAELKDQELCQALDDSLVQKLNNRDYSKTWASMPEIIQDDNFAAFQYSKRINALQYHDVELDACLARYAEKQKPFTKHNLERDTIYVRTHEGNIFPRWQVWKCIYSELEHAGQLYILIDGKWYRVSQDFIARLDKQINAIPRNTYKLPPWKQFHSEQEYLRGLGKGFSVLDRDLIRVRGHSPIEFCDIFISEKIFVHVKRYGSSEVLSHLFNQGKVSAQLFLSDDSFRKEAAKKFNGRSPFSIRERPDSRHYTVAFIVGSKYGDSQKLPLFARVVLVDAFKTLQGFGFSVTLGFVQIEPI